MHWTNFPVSVLKWTWAWVTLCSSKPANRTRQPRLSLRSFLGLAVFSPLAGRGRGARRPRTANLSSPLVFSPPSDPRGQAAARPAPICVLSFHLDEGTAPPRLLLRAPLSFYLPSSLLLYLMDLVMAYLCVEFVCEIGICCVIDIRTSRWEIE